MSCPLLANLHFDRARGLDPKCPITTGPTAAAVSEAHRKDTGTKYGRVSREAGGDEAPLSTALTNATDKHHSLPVAGPARSVTEYVATGSSSSAGAPENASHYIMMACKKYREGVVLHQEAFLRSSEGRFLEVLSLLDAADPGGPRAGQETAQGGACPGEMSAKEEINISQDAPAKAVDTVCGSERRGGGEGEAEGDKERDALVRDVRVACHLNIAAAALLRQQEYESVVYHCTR